MAKRWINGGAQAGDRRKNAGPKLLFGLGFGGWHWWESAFNDVPATAGTVMLTALPVIIGAQLFLSWLNFDVAAELRQPIHPLLEARALDEPQGIQP